MAKRMDSAYEPGKRNGKWLKVKNSRGQEFVIAGWLPGAGRRSGEIGALLTGYYEGDELRFAGKVGTGFGDKELAMLKKRLAALERDDSPLHRQAATAGRALRRARAGRGNRVQRMDA